MDANSQPASVTDRVADLDAAGVLARVRQDRRIADAAEADLLAAAGQWADLHPATAGALDGMPAGRGLDGRERLVPLAGEGTPAVAEFACAELAAALHLSTESGRHLVGDALELRHRLPRCWGRIMAGDLPVWWGRRIAQATTWLSRQAVEQVDAQVAPFAHKLSVGRVEKMVQAAAAEFMPDQAARRAAEAADRRHVSLYDDTSLEGTAHIDIETDVADALAFDATTGAIASQLGVCGDTDTLEVRRAKAVGQIADPRQPSTSCPDSRSPADRRTPGPPTPVALATPPAPLSRRAGSPRGTRRPSWWSTCTCPRPRSPGRRPARARLLPGRCWGGGRPGTPVGICPCWPSRSGPGAAARTST